MFTFSSTWNHTSGCSLTPHYQPPHQGHTLSTLVSKVEKKNPCFWGSVFGGTSSSRCDRSRMGGRGCPIGRLKKRSGWNPSRSLELDKKMGRRTKEFRSVPPSPHSQVILVNICEALVFIPPDQRMSQGKIPSLGKEISFLVRNRDIRKGRPCWVFW